MKWWDGHGLDHVWSTTLSSIDSNDDNNDKVFLVIVIIITGYKTCCLLTTMTMTMITTMMMTMITKMMTAMLMVMMLITFHLGGHLWFSLAFSSWRYALLHGGSCLWFGSAFWSWCYALPRQPSLVQRSWVEWFVFPKVMLCFASVPSTLVWRTSSVPPSWVNAMSLFGNRRRRLWIGLPEMMLCFASAAVFSLDFLSDTMLATCIFPWSSFWI